MVEAEETKIYGIFEGWTALVTVRLPEPTETKDTANSRIQQQPRLQLEHTRHTRLAKIERLSLNSKPNSEWQNVWQLWASGRPLN